MTSEAPDIDPDKSLKKTDLWWADDRPVQPFELEMQWQ